MKLIKLNKLMTLIVCAFMASTFARVKEGGNTILGQSGELVSAKIECLEKQHLSILVNEFKLEMYSKLKTTYEELTFTTLSDSLSVCTVKGGSKELSRILGVSDVSNEVGERVAGWLPPINKNSGLVLLSSDFLNDIDHKNKGRTKKSLSMALFREVLHSMFGKSSSSLTWEQRDIAVSTVLDETLTQLTRDKRSQQEFKAYNNILYSYGLPSAFELDWNKNKILFQSGSNKYQRSIEAFVSYIDIFAAELKAGEKTDAIILNSIYNCVYGSVVENFKCLPYLEQTIKKFKAENRSYNITNHKDTRSVMGDLVRFYAEIYADKYDIRLGTSSYPKESKIDHSDLAASILYLGENKNILNISAELIFRSYVNSSMISYKTSILGMIPFIQSGHLPLNYKFQCNKNESGRTSIYNVYALLYNTPLSSKRSHIEIHFNQMNEIHAALENELLDFYPDFGKNMNDYNEQEIKETLQMMSETCM